MKKFLKGSIFIVIVVAVIFILNNIYTLNITNFINGWSDSSTIYDFYNEPEDSLNVLILGTSTTANGVQPAVLWNEQQITAYNLSTEQQYSIAAYYLLMESLKYQHPDIVIINARWITTRLDIDNEQEDLDNYSGSLHLSLDSMKLSEVKIKAAADIASRSKTQSALNYILPLYVYHGRYDLTKNDFDFSYLSDQHPLKGSSIHLSSNEVFMDNTLMAENSTEAPTTYDFSDISPTYVEKMIELCKANGINVLLLSLPIADWDWSRHTAVQAFAQAHDVSYLDMNTEEIREQVKIDWKKDYADAMHENILGANKTSGFLASYLAANYNFSRNYSDGVVESFNKSYITYSDYLNVYQSILSLKNKNKLDSYLLALADLKDDIVVISAKDDFSTSLSDNQKEYLHALGLQTDYNANNFRYSYAAIIDSGNVVFEECAPTKIKYRYQASSDINISVTSAGNAVGNMSSIQISDKEYSPNYRGLNIVVYSKKLGGVIDSVNFDTFAGSDSLRY